MMHVPGQWEALGIPDASIACASCTHNLYAALSRALHQVQQHRLIEQEQSIERII